MIHIVSLQKFKAHLNVYLTSYMNELIPQKTFLFRRGMKLASV